MFLVIIGIIVRRKSEFYFKFCLLEFSCFSLFEYVSSLSNKKDWGRRVREVSSSLG